MIGEAAPASRHFRPMADAPEMMRIAQRDNGRAVLLGARDGEVRGGEADGLSVALATVEDQQRRSVELHLRRLVDREAALLQRLYVARHHADAVRIMAA